MTESPSDLTSALSGDIRLLGNLLGNVIREQHGDAAFDLVERVRLAAKARRSGDDKATAELSQIIEDLDVPSKRILTKAFSNYFQLINIAEDRQRIRALRRSEANGTLKESIDAAICQLQAMGVTAAQMRMLLDKLRVRLVLTAHPSEAKRKEVLVKLRDIAQLMTTRDQGALLPREEHTLVATLTRRIEELWQTRPTRAARATVGDEVDFGLYFITSAIMDVALDIYDELQMSLSGYYPEEDWTDLPPVLRFATWMGGDRDGNPNVTPAVTLEALETMRNAARQVYLADVAYLRERLTQSMDEVGVSKALLTTLGDPSMKYPGEIYRQKMALIGQRLNEDGYATGQELLDDISLVIDSLRANRGTYTANSGTLRRLAHKVRLFGLHLVAMDIREDARVHSVALDELFRTYGQEQNYLKLPEERKQELLTREIANLRPLFPMTPLFSEPTNRVIETWRMIAEAHRRYGKVVIDGVIASMSEQPSDVLTLLLLAREVGIQNDVDLVPLFETIDDLHRAPEVMTTLFDNPEYSKYLAARGNRQQIMIGYSDSNKDGGYLASNWHLHEAQHNLARLCAARKVDLELFHGRGGSIGRGGGPTNQAILSQPPYSMQGSIKITEQGEVIAYRYSNAVIAQRHLNQVMNAALLATNMILNLRSVSELRPEWRAAMGTLAGTGRSAYYHFVYENPGFLDYWQQATPINELGKLQIGSRPTKRSKGGFESIRAIPWVFSWMQSRAIIPSWYGVGHALEAFCQQTDGLATLQSMYREWLFFRALIDNVQLDLAKADMGIAELYAGLVADAELCGRIFSDMQTEHARACKLICDITGQREVLDNMPVIKRSIERRNPYVDPLNFIQVALLRELRALPAETPDFDERLEAVLATINGIAAGMKTTG
jgi:phosphoenolpyruvate carboxylase